MAYHELWSRMEKEQWLILRHNYHDEAEQTVSYSWTFADCLFYRQIKFKKRNYAAAFMFAILFDALKWIDPTLQDNNNL